MFEFLSRHRLEWRGLSSGKKRRTVAESDLLTALQSGLPAKTAIFLVFAFVMVIFQMTIRQAIIVRCR